jgi:hypothetical protein
MGPENWGGEKIWWYQNISERCIASGADTLRTGFEGKESDLLAPTRLRGEIEGRMLKPAF